MVSFNKFDELKFVDRSSFEYDQQVFKFYLNREFYYFLYNFSSNKLGIFLAVTDLMQPLKESDNMLGAMDAKSPKPECFFHESLKIHSFATKVINGCLDRYDSINIIKEVFPLNIYNIL